MKNYYEVKLKGKGPKSLRMYCILIFDIILSTIASLAAVLMVRWLSDPFGSLKHYVYIWTLWGCICSIPAFLATGSYRISLLHSSYRSIGRLMCSSAIKAILLGVLLLTGLLRLSAMQVEIMILLVDLALTILQLVFVRVVIISVNDVIQSSPESKIDSNFILVYGTSDKSVAMVPRFKSSSHYNVCGFISPDRKVAGLKFQSVLAYSFETIDDVLALKRRLGVDGILFARTSDFEEERTRLVQYCLKLGIHVIMSPAVAELDGLIQNPPSKRAVATISASAHEVMEPVIAATAAAKEVAKAARDGGEWVSEEERDYIPDGMTALERGVKRLFSIIISTGCLIVFSPLFLIIAIAIKREDGGPVFYKQERIGRFGRPFQIYKFRSMRTDAESSGPALYAGDDDPRLTKVGHFIRSHHLDELPQLLNVFRGEMAFVGPRPERKYFIDQILERDPRYRYLYQIRPGVTSYATYYNGYTDTIEKMLRRLRYDLYYLKHRSWWFDIKVLWMTFRSIVGGKKF